MENLIVMIDLSEREDKLNVIHSFENALGMELSEKGSWDAFSDNLRSLDTQSSLVIEKKPKSVHLVLKRVGDFEQRCIEMGSNDYNILLNILSESTDKNQRYDGMNFTYEVDNGRP